MGNMLHLVIQEKKLLFDWQKRQTLNSLQYLTQLVINRYSNQYLM